MRILHTSDWHLGMTAGGHTCEKDQRFFLEQLYSIIKEQDIDAVICAGDVYDSSVSNADAISIYNEAMTEICLKLGRTCVVIAGNHDGPERLASCSELLKHSGLYVSGRLTKEIEPVRLEDADIYPIPFFNREEAAAFYPEECRDIKTDQEAMQIVCDHIRSRMDRKKRNIAVAHAFVVGAELSESDRSARVGQAAAISEEVFRDFDYTALGHIHKPQSITDSIRYSGTPVKYSFGAEEQQEKSVTVIDTATMEREIIPLRLLHDRRSITGAYEEIKKRRELAGDYLRLTVTDRYATMDLFRELQEQFPYLLELNGKDTEAIAGGSTMTLEELNSLDEIAIMKKYMQENYGVEPDREQTELFREALSYVRKGGEEQ